MLKEGLDVYVPLVDDDAVDVLVKRSDGSIAQVQVKARSADVTPGDAALFSAITHELREDYWFVFYSERLEKVWLMESEDFIREGVQNKNGKHVGKRAIWFNGRRKGLEYAKERFARYEVENFARLAQRPMQGQLQSMMRATTS